MSAETIMVSGNRWVCESFRGVGERVRAAGDRLLLAVFFGVLLTMVTGATWVQGQEHDRGVRNGGEGQDPSAGQIASVFEQEPEWLEWIASKNFKPRSSASSSSWGSWTGWWGTNKKSGGAISSYRRDNKTMSQRMWLSTKRMWSTTASWLDPYPAPKPESAMRPAKKSWYSSWGGWGDKTDKPSQSVSEFIGQEHPK